MNFGDFGESRKAKKRPEQDRKRPEEARKRPEEARNPEFGEKLLETQCFMNRK